jgi:6-phosphogluconolactonase
LKEIDIFNYDWRKKHPPTIYIRETKEDLLEIIANRFLELVILTQTNKKFFSVIMGGGRTPGPLNKIIVELSRTKEKDIDWSHLFIFFSDERCVSPDHSDSNYKLILDTLVKPLGIPKKNIFRILGEVEPSEAASDYHNTLTEFGGNQGTPVFDLALLGFGADGHTASLFPNSEALKINHHFAAPGGIGPDGWNRVTVTFPVFNSAKNVWLLGTGAEKSHAFEQLIKGNYDPVQWPIQGIFPYNGTLIYWIDSTVRDGA